MPTDCRSDKWGPFQIGIVLCRSCAACRHYVAADILSRAAEAVASASGCGGSGAAALIAPGVPTQRVLLVASHNKA